MEFILLVFALLIPPMIMYVLHSTIAQKYRYKFPPGPRQLPIIGNIHNLRGPLPHHTLRDLARKYGPLMHLQLSEVHHIIVSSPAVVKDIFRTHDINFAQRSCQVANGIVSYNFSDIIFAPYENHWRQLRKICMMELLGSNQIRSFRSIREDEIFNMIKSIYSQEGLAQNISRKMFSLSYAIIARAAFGKISKYNDKFLALMDEIVEILGGFDVADLFPSFKIVKMIGGLEKKTKMIHKQVDEIMEAILNEHKDKMAKVEIGSDEIKEDIIDVILKIQVIDRIIKAVIFGLLEERHLSAPFRSHWTNEGYFLYWRSDIINKNGMALSEIIKNPQVMKSAQDEVRKAFSGKGNVSESSLDELKYLQAIVKETLRLHPAGPLLLPRESSEQCEINSYMIPGKTRVIINAWTINRDSMSWIEAEKYDPGRFLDCKRDYRGNDFEYIPFGGGRRICPGISFAVRIIELSVAQLLYHFDWKLPGGMEPESLEMGEKFALTVRRKNDLELIPIPYAHSCLNSK